MNVKRFISLVLSISMCASFSGFAASPPDKHTHDAEYSDSSAVEASVYDNASVPEIDNEALPRENLPVADQALTDSADNKQSDASSNTDIDLPDSYDDGGNSANEEDDAYDADKLADNSEPEQDSHQVPGACDPSNLDTDKQSPDSDEILIEPDDSTPDDLPGTDDDISGPGNTGDSLDIEPEPDFDTERYIVVYDRIPDSDDNLMASAYSVSAASDGSDELFYEVLQLTADDAEALSLSDEIAYIEKDHQITAFDEQEVYDEITAASSSQIFNWGYNYTGAALISDEYRGQGVKIAVLDSGISPHADLTVAGGVSFVDYTSSYKDDNGHGTHVAGIIAAKDNDIGIVGVAPEAEIYAVKVLGSNGKGNYSSLIKGIEWSIKNGMDIINLSLGGKEASPTLERTINKAADAGIIVIAAAGNYGPASNTVTYPAKYPASVAVASTDKYSYVSGFSGRGSEIDISAPGSAVESLSINGSAYELRNGTSQAAPFVAAAAAILLSKNNSASADDVINALYNSTSPLKTTDPSCVGCGLLNIPKALDALGSPPASPDGNPEIMSDSEAIAYDIRITQYRDKLRSYRDMAIKNGQTELSKEINHCLEQMVQEDVSMRIASADDGQLDKSDFYGIEDTEAFYYENSDELYDIEEYYKKTVEIFSERFKTSANANDGIASSGSPSKILVNTPVDISTGPGQSIVYSFTPQQSGEYTIKTGRYGGIGALCDTILHLYEDSALQSAVAYNDNNADNDGFSAITRTLSAGKTYYIRVSHFNSSSGIVHARLSINNGAFDISKPIAANDTVYAHIENGNHEVYCFIPSKTAVYKIYTDSDTDFADTYLELYRDRQLNNRLAFSDDINGSPHSSIIYQLNKNTKYYIKLSGYAGGNVNATISIEQDANAVTKIYADSSVSATLSGGRYIIYKFTPSESGLHTVKTSSEDALSDTVIELYSDICMTELLAVDDDSGQGTSSSIVYNLNRGSTYFIRLSGYNMNSVKTTLTITK